MNESLQHLHSMESCNESITIDRSVSVNEAVSVYCIQVLVNLSSLTQVCYAHSSWSLLTRWFIQTL